MNFDLKKPCKGCPFRKGEGAVRLTEGRVHEVWRSATHNGPMFQCHNTVDYDSSDFDDEELGVVSKGEAQHCLGAVIAGVNSGDGPNQYARVCAQLKLLDVAAVEACADEVFSSEEEMLATAIRRTRKKAKARR